MAQGLFQSQGFQIHLSKEPVDDFGFREFDD
jgi:hypothetical protein